MPLCCLHPQPCSNNHRMRNKIHKTLSVYERGEQARISVDAAREVNDSTNDTVKIINLQCQGWNR